MKKSYLLLFVILLTATSCSVLKTISNVSRLQFKLSETSNVTLDGISMDDKQKLSDFNPLEIAKISASLIKGKVPISFTLYVDAKNPNDGSGGYPKTDIMINSFPWRLFIDNSETILGDIKEPVSVPGVGEQTRIPIQISFDLLKFFKDKNYQGIINLALSLSGIDSKPTNLKLLTKPVLGTPIGPIQYSKEIEIVNAEFR